MDVDLVEVKVEELIVADVDILVVVVLVLGKEEIEILAEVETFVVLEKMVFVDVELEKGIFVIVVGALNKVENELFLVVFVDEVDDLVDVVVALVNVNVDALVVVVDEVKFVLVEVIEDEFVDCLFVVGYIVVLEKIVVELEEGIIVEDNFDVDEVDDVVVFRVLDEFVKILIVLSAQIVARYPLLSSFNPKNAALLPERE